MHRTEYSSLRQGLLAAYCPSLGASGRLLVDRGPMANHATFSGTTYSWSRDLSITGATFAAGTYNPRLDFERTDSFSVSAWLNATTLAERSVVTNSINIGVTGWELQINSAGNIRLLLGNNFSTNFLRSSTVGSFAMTAGVTAHVVATYPGTSSAAAVRFYINGVLVNTNSDINNLTSSTVTGAPLRFFSRSNASAQWAGSIDDLRIYSRVITPPEALLLASRRGIGLTPLPDRAAGLPRRFSVNVGGDWRSADSYVNVGGDWRLSQPSVNVGGVWK